MKKQLLICAMATLALTAGAQVMNVPYESTLGTTSLDKDWTVIDNNSDGATWRSMHQCVSEIFYNRPEYDGVYGAFSMYSEEGNDMDDFLISPAIRLSAGETYTVKFEVQSERNTIWYDSWEFYMSKSKDPEAIVATTPLIAEDYYGYWDDHEGYRYGYQVRTLIITPEESGNYYFSFHISTPASFNEYMGGAGIAVRDFSIKGGEEVPAVTPADILKLERPQEGTIEAGRPNSLGNICFTFTGEGEIETEVGMVTLAYKGTAVREWAIDSPNIKIDGNTLYFFGTEAKDFYLPGEYVFTIPEGFFKQGNNTNNKVTVVWNAEPTCDFNTVIEFVKNEEGDITGVRISEGENLWDGFGPGDEPGIILPTVLPSFELTVSGENGEIQKFGPTQVGVNRKVVNANLSTPIKSEGTYTATLKAGSTAWSSTTNYPMGYFYNAEATVTEKYSSVALTAAEEDAEYFNLQGMRIERPQTGMCIVRQGGLTKKVIIK